MTASREPATQQATPRSRRAILAGALGGIGAWAAAAVGSRTKVAAADGDPVLIGEANSASSTTSLTNSSTSTVFEATATANGTAISGYSPDAQGIMGGSENGTGVFGNVGQGIGVFGNSNGQSGVWGQTDGDSAGTVGWSKSGNKTGVMGLSGDPDSTPRAKTGVYGIATQDAGSRGVVGLSPKGQGVRGEATSGVGLFGTATSGFALQTEGRAKFSTSGVASIPAGSTSVTVTPGVNIVGGSFVLLTPMANLGSRALWFTKNETANTITIRMSSSRTSATKVAWLLLG